MFGITFEIVHHLKQPPFCLQLGMVAWEQEIVAKGMRGKDQRHLHRLHMGDGSWV